MSNNNNTTLFEGGWNDIKVSKKMLFDLEEVNKRKLTRNHIDNT